MSPFDLPTAPLQPGVTLIEASAGTGKTFTITGLILRFVIEQRLPLREILAVTFTNAATAELRERVRRRLTEALAQLRQETKVSDEILTVFLARGGDRAAAIRDLNLAVQSFDEAQIFTIHGFCQRVLRENAFESGVPFDLELITDCAPLLEEVRRDFWRARFYEATPLISRLAQASHYSPDSWKKLLEQSTLHPGLRIIPAADPLSCAQLAEELEQVFAEIRTAWPEQRVSVTDLLENSKSLSRNKKTGLPPPLVAECLAGLDLLSTTSPTEIPIVTWQVLEIVTQSSIDARSQPSKPPISHPFFALCESFAQLRTRFFHQLNHEFLRETALTLPRLKQRSGVQTYDDLLQQLHRVLSSDEGSSLTETLRRQYRVALIDEFQDTDPIQYAIFHRVFAEEPHHLYYIGDPKQAIYAFRGADIFTYLEAARSAAQRATLVKNYRSEPALLTALNALFSNPPSPFANDEIRYHALACGLEKSAWSGDFDPARLRFRWLPSEDQDWNQTDAAALIGEAVVADLQRLIASGSRLGDRALCYRDVAILVHTKTQAAALQNRLRARGIKSVLQTTDSVFASHEAITILRLAKAVLEPGRDSLLRAALCTSLIGLEADSLYALAEQPTEHQGWLEAFLELRALWEKAGFITMFRAALVRFDSRRKLVVRPDGERQLTNFLHLAELLHEAETAQRLAPESLCAWLRAQIHEPGGQEEHQLRLESDEDAVTLMTIHKSKGLEFPIVFCPFLWKPTDGQKDPTLIFHDPASRALTYDLRPAKQAAASLAQYAAERHQEMLRVLYVAITRAQHCAFVYAGDIKEFARSPLHHMLGETGLAELSAAAKNTISLSFIAPEAEPLLSAISLENTAESLLRARPFTANIPLQRMITSFTGLTSGHLAEEPEHTDAPPEEPLEPSTGELSPIGDFERGARAGVFFHELLEKLDFQSPARLISTVSHYLSTHGFSARDWRDPLARQLSTLLNTVLAPGLRLADLGAADRLNELEFSHPIVALRSADLQRVFAQHRSTAMPERLPEALGRLRFDPVEGWLRGFMDLLFQHEGRYYLVDWKSNWLGAHLADYEPRSLAGCMIQNAYHLQYHLYTVAIDLFLRQRLPRYNYERHFGGVFYVFLRGIDPQTPTRGLFHARPQAALIQALGALFTGEKS